MTLSIAHVCINTRDLKATRAFYENALGLNRVFDFTKNGAVKGCYLKVSERTFIEIFEVDDVDTAPSALAHLCLETDDIDGMKARLEAHGIATTDKKKRVRRHLSDLVQRPERHRHRAARVHRHQRPAHPPRPGDGLVKRGQS